MSHIAGKIKKWIRCSAHTKFEPATGLNPNNDIVLPPPGYVPGGDIRPAPPVLPPSAPPPPVPPPVAPIVDDRYPGRGSIPAASLSTDDAAYLWSRALEYRSRVPNGDIFRAVCSGSHDDISRAIQLGEQANPNMERRRPDNESLIAAVDRLF